MEIPCGFPSLGVKAFEVEEITGFRIISNKSRLIETKTKRDITIDASFLTAAFCYCSYFLFFNTHIIYTNKTPPLHTPYN